MTHNDGNARHAGRRRVEELVGRRRHLTAEGLAAQVPADRVAELIEAIEEKMGPRIWESGEWVGGWVGG